MKCGACTLCCNLFPVVWLKKPANTMCKYICDQGCAIHLTKPEECTGFTCAYAQMKKVRVDLRPDKCGVIFEKITDKIFLGTYHPKTKRTMMARDQIRLFLRQGYSVIMVSSMMDRKPELLLAKSHNREGIKKEFGKALTKRYGSSVLYN